MLSVVSRHSWWITSRKITIIFDLWTSPYSCSIFERLWGAFFSFFLFSCVFDVLLLCCYLAITYCRKIDTKLCLFRNIPPFRNSRAYPMTCRWCSAILITSIETANLSPFLARWVPSNNKNWCYLPSSPSTPSGCCQDYAAGESTNFRSEQPPPKLDPAVSRTGNGQRCANANRHIRGLLSLTSVEEQLGQ